MCKTNVSQFVSFNFVIALVQTNINASKLIRLPWYILIENVPLSHLRSKGTASAYITSGAVLEGFLRFPETTQDFPSTIGAPLFGYNVSRGIHSGLNSGVNWPLF